MMSETNEEIRQLSAELIFEQLKDLESCASLNLNSYLRLISITI